jgi:dTMP kinase
VPQSRFIVFEGIDGSGTTTQAAMLAARLGVCGVEVVQTREPGGTAVGERIRELVLDPAAAVADTAEMLLYAASRAQHVAELIRPSLQRGVTVISDRFVDSSLAYQGCARSLGLDLVRAANRPAVAECAPDLVVYLEVPISVARQRRLARGGPPDRVEAAGDALQELVAAAYRQLAAERGAAALVVDGTQSREPIAELIWHHVCTRWPELGHQRPRRGGPGPGPQTCA